MPARTMGNRIRESRESKHQYNRIGETGAARTKGNMLWENRDIKDHGQHYSIREAGRSNA